MEVNEPGNNHFTEGMSHLEQIEVYVCMYAFSLCVWLNIYIYIYSH
jgi:hypothetical protein